MPTTYDIGPGQPLTAMTQLNWDSLLPGDTVRVHANNPLLPNFTGTEPYYERLHLTVSGTVAQPITIVGIPHPITGAMPIIDGGGDEVRNINCNDCASNNPYATGDQFQNWGLILIMPHDTEGSNYRTSNWIIDGFEIRRSQRGRGHYIYIGGVLTGASWAQATGGISIYRAANITIQNCFIHDNDNGIFGTSSAFNPPYRWISNITLRNNTIQKNGSRLPFIELLDPVTPQQGGGWGAEVTSLGSHNDGQMVAVQVDNGGQNYSPATFMNLWNELSVSGGQFPCETQGQSRHGAVVDDPPVINFSGQVISVNVTDPGCGLEFRAQKQHNTYLEAYGVLYEFNTYFGSYDGLGMKDRSAGCIIRYNRIYYAGGVNLDLVENEDIVDPQMPLPNPWDPLYQNTYVYGNVFEWDGGHSIEFGQDGFGPASLPRPFCWFYHNTFVDTLEGAGGGSDIFKCDGGGVQNINPLVYMYNNVLHKYAPDGNPELWVLGELGQYQFGSGWAWQNLDPTHDGGVVMGFYETQTFGPDALLDPSGDPNTGYSDWKPLANSPTLGIAQPLPSELANFPVLFNPDATPRPSTHNTGAWEFSTTGPVHIAAHPRANPAVIANLDVKYHIAAVNRSQPAIVGDLTVTHLPLHIAGHPTGHPRVIATVHNITHLAALVRARPRMRARQTHLSSPVGQAPDRIHLSNTRPRSRPKVTAALHVTAHLSAMVRDHPRIRADLALSAFAFGAHPRSQPKVIAKLHVVRHATALVRVHTQIRAPLRTTSRPSAIVQAHPRVRATLHLIGHFMAPVRSRPRVGARLRQIVHSFSAASLAHARVRARLRTTRHISDVVRAHPRVMARLRLPQAFPGYMGSMDSAAVSSLAVQLLTSQPALVARIACHPRVGGRIGFPPVSSVQMPATSRLNSSPRRALRMAVRDTIRFALNLDKRSCEVMFNGQPPANAGERFIAVHGGDVTNDSRVDIDEVFSVDVTVTCRATKIPFDRWGPELILKLLPGLADGVDDLCHRIKIAIHNDANDTRVIRAANRYMGAGPDGFSGINYFVETLFFASEGDDTVVGPDWFHAKTGIEVGLVRKMHFAGARRLEPLEGLG